MHKIKLADPLLEYIESKLSHELKLLNQLASFNSQNVQIHLKT
jgi:hypothetical protein